MLANSDSNGHPCFIIERNDARTIDRATKGPGKGKGQQDCRIQRVERHLKRICWKRARWRDFCEYVHQISLASMYVYLCIIIRTGNGISGWLQGENTFNRLRSKATFQFFEALFNEQIVDVERFRIFQNYGTRRWVWILRVKGSKKVLRRFAIWASVSETQVIKVWEFDFRRPHRKSSPDTITACISITKPRFVKWQRTFPLLLGCGIYVF